MHPIQWDFHGDTIHSTDVGRNPWRELLSVRIAFTTAYVMIAGVAGGQTPISPPIGYPMVPVQTGPIGSSSGINGVPNVGGPMVPNIASGPPPPVTACNAWQFDLSDATGCNLTFYLIGLR